MKKTSRLIVLFNLLAISSLAQAEFYLSGNYGISQIEYSDVKDGSAFKASAGYIFENNFAVDIAFFDSGEMDIDENSIRLADYKLYLFKGMSYSAAYYLRPPKGENWYITARVGLYDAESIREERDTGAQISENGTGLGWGMGIGYMLFNHLVLGFDVDRYYGIKDFADEKTLTIVTGRLAIHF